MSQTKFSNPVNPSTGPMSPSPSAETVKGGRGTTTSGAKTTHEQDSGAEKGRARTGEKRASRERHAAPRFRRFHLPHR